MYGEYSFTKFQMEGDVRDFIHTYAKYIAIRTLVKLGGHDLFNGWIAFQAKACVKIHIFKY